jgi:transposase
MRETPNELLRKRINEHVLSYKEVSAMLGVSIPTVRSWLAIQGTKNYRKMPTGLIQLLEIKCVLLRHDDHAPCSL